MLLTSWVASLAMEEWLFAGMQQAAELSLPMRRFNDLHARAQNTQAPSQKKSLKYMSEDYHAETQVPRPKTMRRFIYSLLCDCFKCFLGGRAARS